ncbi:MAG: S24/S26 family peptidase [Planctomycetes bacterium]|nr:S24/S26 family peptidase [Planctomycetota bacterium]
MNPHGAKRDRRGVADWIRWLRIVGFAVVGVTVLVFVWRFQFLRVPAGMDTLPDALPPGSIVVIEKRPSVVRVGAIVLLRRDGGVVFTRVHEVLPDGRIRTRHDNPASRLGGDEVSGPFAVAELAGLVLDAMRVCATPEVPVGR